MRQKRLFPKSMRWWLIVLTVALHACGDQDRGAFSDQSAASAQSASQPAADRPLIDEREYSNRGDAALPDASEAAAVTHRQIELDGRTLRYTATTGHLTAAVDSGKRASMFYVAYTVDDRARSKRPVTFLFNGGPVTASVWLHLGSWGPKRIAAEARGTNALRPTLIDSDDSLLDQSDLVFVDAVGTGYSQAIAPSVNRDFWGVDQDAAAFHGFILHYIEVNRREASPIYLYGESYGGIRAAVLANLLATSGATLGGVVLNSPILNFNTACDLGAPDCTGFIPSYAAVSTHHRVSNKPDAMPAADYARQAGRFAVDIYRPALLDYLRRGAAPSAVLLADLAGYTGIAPAEWARHLNMTPDLYVTRVRPGYVIDINDGRNSAPAGSDWQDPYRDALEAGIHALLPDFLGYRARSAYSMGAGDAWTWEHDGLPLPDAIPDLASALAQSPGMQVVALNGYHDLNCPFLQTELELERVGYAHRVRSHTFAGGHMTYLTEASRQPMRQALRDLYRQAGDRS